MSAAILLIARLLMIKTKWPLFAEGHDRDLLRAYAGLDEITARGLRSFVPQNHVIVAGPALVTMPFDSQDRSRMIFEIGCIVIERFHSAVRYRPLIVSVEYILETRFYRSFLCRLFFLRELRPPTRTQIRRA